MEEPVHIEKTIPVPFVKHVPQPVPVYVPQPYPVEKKVYVPYKVYEKQPVPIIHRYPVEKSVRIPVHVPIEQPVAILVPYPVPIGKRLSFQIPIHSRSYPGLRQIPFTTIPEHDRVLYPRDKMKFEADKPILVPEEVENLMKKNSIPSPKPSPSSYTTERIISYGTRLPVPSRDIEKQEGRSGKESVQQSELVQIITPAPVVGKCEANTTPIIDSTDSIDKKDEERKTEIDESKEGSGIIVFPTEQRDVELKS